MKHSHHINIKNQTDRPPVSLIIIIRVLLFFILRPTDGYVRPGNVVEQCKIQINWHSSSSQSDCNILLRFSIKFNGPIVSVELFSISPVSLLQTSSADVISRLILSSSKLSSYSSLKSQRGVWTNKCTYVLCSLYSCCFSWTQSAITRLMTVLDFIGLKLVEIVFGFPRKVNWLAGTGARVSSNWSCPSTNQNMSLISQFQTFPDSKHGWN